MDDHHKSALKAEWEAGSAGGDHTLAQRYSISLSRLRAIALREGWVRRTAPEPEKVYDLAGLLSFDPNEQAALGAAQVVVIHRKDVSRLRTMAMLLLERLALVVAGKQPVGEDEQPVPTLGGRESPADLLEKLSRVMVRTTEIERQAYGLKTFNPEQAASDAELQKELSELEDSLDIMAKEKAAK